MCLWGPKNQFFENNSGKSQPIKTKVGTQVYVEGRQRLRNFRRDRLREDKMRGDSRAARVFSAVNQTIFREVPNRRLPPNLVTKRKSMSP